jgi:hypothetical protein
MVAAGGKQEGEITRARRQTSAGRTLADTRIKLSSTQDVRWRFPFGIMSIGQPGGTALEACRPGSTEKLPVSIAGSGPHAGNAWTRECHVETASKEFATKSHAVNQREKAKS